MIADVVGQIFWYGMLATPLIAYFIVRKLNNMSPGAKIFAGILITFILAAIFFFISMEILLRDGLGPT